jgi:hypothetical protein
MCNTHQFTLRDSEDAAVNAPEWIIPITALRRIAAEAGFEVAPSPPSPPPPLVHVYFVCHRKHHGVCVCVQGHLLPQPLLHGGGGDNSDAEVVHSAHTHPTDPSPPPPAAQLIVAPVTAHSSTRQNNAHKHSA